MTDPKPMTPEAKPFSESDCIVRSFDPVPPGGQHCGIRPDVLAVHLPSGLAVVENGQRSQMKNKQRAMERLRELVASEALVEALKGDKERLDWMNEHPHGVYWNVSQFDGQSGWMSAIGNIAARYSSLRSAIDYARASRPSLEVGK